MAEQKLVRLFRSGRHQVVRIPKAFELPGDEVTIRRDGARLIVQPVRKRGLIALLKTMKRLKEDLREIADALPAPERPL